MYRRPKTLFPSARWPQAAALALTVLLLMVVAGSAAA